jgi:hypothetical protein
MFGTLYWGVASNTDFSLGILDPETAKFLVRTGVVTIVGFLPLIWVFLWLTNRLGQDDAMLRLEAKLDANTAISQEASDHADAAYHEANSVNSKIAAAETAILAQNDDRSADRAEAKITAGQVDDIHRKVDA